MAALTRPTGLPLWSDYTRFVRRHAAGIFACMSLGLLAGFGWSTQQPPTYSATASVELTQVPVYVTHSTSELVPPEVSIDTDAQLLHSPRVLGPVGEVLGTDAESASEHLSVTASPNSHVLHVTVSADSRQQAAEAADAAVGAFVEVRRDALGALALDQQLQLRFLVTSHEQLLAEEQERRVVIPAQDDLFAQIFELRTSLDELEAARDTPATVLVPAELPNQRDYANTEVPMASGAMLGLLAGCLLGIARDRAPLRGLHQARPRFLAEPSGYLPDATTRLEGYHHAV